MVSKSFAFDNENKNYSNKLVFNFLKNKRLFGLFPKNFTQKNKQKKSVFKSHKTPTTLRLIAPDQEPMSYLPG